MLISRILCAIYDTLRSPTRSIRRERLGHGVKQRKMRQNASRLLRIAFGRLGCKKRWLTRSDLQLRAHALFLCIPGGCGLIHRNSESEVCGHLTYTGRFARIMHGTWFIHRVPLGCGTTNAPARVPGVKSHRGESRSSSIHADKTPARRRTSIQPGSHERLVGTSAMPIDTRAVST